MNVVAFNAKDVPSQYSLKTKVREYFAKFKAVIDLYPITQGAKVSWRRNQYKNYKIKSQY
jgi:vancomycin permeability regulator SanA